MRSSGRATASWPFRAGHEADLARARRGASATSITLVRDAVTPARRTGRVAAGTAQWGDRPASDGARTPGPDGGTLRAGGAGGKRSRDPTQHGGTRTSEVTTGDDGVAYRAQKSRKLSRLSIASFTEILRDVGRPGSSWRPSRICAALRPVLSFVIPEYVVLLKGWDHQRRRSRPSSQAMPMPRSARSSPISPRPPTISQALPMPTDSCAGRCARRWRRRSCCAHTSVHDVNSAA